MKHCLVVDDSSVIRKVARRILEDLDFFISEAEDGQQALDVCRDQMPDAILLDWNIAGHGRFGISQNLAQTRKWGRSESGLLYDRK